MSGRIGETFDAIVTSVTPHGTFVRVVHPHVEGLLAQGQQGADVGDRLRVTLIRTDILSTSLADPGVCHDTPSGGPSPHTGDRRTLVVRDPRHGGADGVRSRLHNAIRRA
jgi:hypothetical protein